MTRIANIPAELVAGDLLLYGDDKFSNELVKWKEADPDTDHIEVYLGGSMTFASRNGIGVNMYPFNPNGLVHVRRPLGTFDLASVMCWAPLVKGAPYGWGDIGANIDLSEQPEDGVISAELIQKHGVDCSHAAALIMAIGKTPQFDPGFNWRKITPRDFKIVRESIPIWDCQAPATNPPTPILSPRAQGETIHAA